MIGKVNWARAKRQAKKILEALEIVAPPVPLELIVEFGGAEVSLAPAEDDVSGFIYRQDSNIIIGINKNHPPNRRRFTLAHELGHLFLHDRDFFIDKRYRNQNSSQAKDPEEIEANTFAAELLMPEDFIHDDVSRLEDDMSFKEAIKQLANRYKVSEEAMEHRLTRLGLITFED